MLCFLNFCSLSRTRRRYIGLKKSCLVIYRVSFWSSLTFDTWVSMCTLKAKGKKIICNRQSISFLHLTVIYQLHPIKWERIIKTKLCLPSRDSTLFSQTIHQEDDSLEQADSLDLLKKKIMSLSPWYPRESFKR